MTLTRRRRILGWLIVVGLCFLVVPALNTHAVARHGSTAYSAHRYIRRYECDPDCEHDDRLFVGIQEDGRTAVVLELPQLPGTPVTWAIMVIGGFGLVTCFLSQSRRKVDKLKSRCR